MATDEQLDDIESQIIADVESGMNQVSVDGMNVGMQDPVRRIDALDRLRRRSVVDPLGCVRIGKLVSPGGGG